MNLIHNMLIDDDDDDGTNLQALPIPITALATMLMNLIHNMLIDDDDDGTTLS